MPPSNPSFRPQLQSHGPTLTKYLQGVSTSAGISAPAAADSVRSSTTCVSVSIPAPVPMPVTISSSPLSSPPVGNALPVTVASPATWHPPTLEEFIADVEHRANQPVLYHYNDMLSATDFLIKTQQEQDPVELVEARNMALATRGIFASCTPTMAWNYYFSDMEAFYSERFAQVNAQAKVNET